MKGLLLPFLVFLYSISVQAQRADMQANHWFFGNNAAINFQLGQDPVLSASNNINTQKASMTYSDKKGDLVLYSNGSRVWNKNGNVVEGAENLIRAFDPSYPGLIVPIPENEGSFYVFSVDDSRGNNNPTAVEFPIFYTKLDMNANNGEGKTISTPLPIWNETSFGLTTVKHCNNVDYWLVIHKGRGNGFLTYLITKDGLDLTNYPIESKFGISFIGSSQGLQQEIIASENGKKIALTKPANPEGGFIEIFDFDNTSGKITRSVSSYKNLGKIKGAAFSPDASFIYVSIFANQESISATELRNDYKVIQLRTIPAPTYEALIAEKSYTGQTSGELGEFLVETGGFGNLKLGPNGKIYMAHLDASFLSVINKPNSAGSASDFDYAAFGLGGKTSRAQFPATVSPDYPKIEAKVVFVGDSLVCNPTLDAETKNVEEKDAKYQWFRNGSEISGATNKVYKAVETGDYLIKVFDECRETKSLTKSLRVASNVQPPISDTTFQYCQGQDILPLEAKGNELKWYGDQTLETVLGTSDKFIPTFRSNEIEAKTYYVTQTINNCESSPSEIKIEILKNQSASFSEPIKKICFSSGEAIELQLSQAPENNLEWYFNNKLVSTSKSYAANSYGIYVIKTPNSMCAASDTMKVEEGCLRIYIPTAFSPNGDGKNENLTLYGNGNFEFDYQVFDRRGRVMVSLKNISFENQPIPLWDGLYLNSPVSTGSYHYILTARIEKDGMPRTEIREGHFTLLR